MYWKITFTHISLTLLEESIYLKAVVLFVYFDHQKIRRIILIGKGLAVFEMCLDVSFDLILYEWDLADSFFLNDQCPLTASGFLMIFSLSNRNFS